MASFKLDDIRAAAEAKYGSTDIEVGEETVSLVNVLRLPKTKRDELMAIQEKLDGEGVDQAAVLSDAIRLVAKTEKQAETLLAAVGDDLAVLVELFNKYTAGTQVGEASASDD